MSGWTQGPNFVHVKSSKLLGYGWNLPTWNASGNGKAFAKFIWLGVFPWPSERRSCHEINATSPPPRPLRCSSPQNVDVFSGKMAMRIAVLSYLELSQVILSYLKLSWVFFLNYLKLFDVFFEFSWVTSSYLKWYDVVLSYRKLS